MAPNDESPLRRLAREEPGAARACIDAYAPLVRALARRLLPRGLEVDDVVQEVFIDLWKAAGRFDPSKASDRGFVAMIARRRVIDRRRKQDRRVETVAMSPSIERASEEHGRTVRRVEASGSLAALEVVPEDRRRWIVMSVVEGYSHSDIARATGAPLGTVKSGIRRGLIEMRRWFERQGSQEVET